MRLSRRRSDVLSMDRPVGIIIGSSTIAGVGAGSSWPDKSISSLVEAAIRGKVHPDAAGEPRTANAGANWPRATRTGGVSNSSGLGHTNILISAGSSAQWSMADCTGAWFGLREGEGTGTVTVSVDGGPQVSIPLSTSGDLAFSASWDSGELPRGSHTFEFSTTGETVIDFVHLYDGDNTAGAIMLNGGWGGSLLDWHLTANQQALTLRPRLRHIDPDFIILSYGSNEESAGKTQAEVTATLNQMLTVISEECTKNPWIVLSSQDAPKDEGYDREQIIGPMRTAAALDPANRDFTDAMEGYWSGDIDADKAAGILASDGVHPTARGHADLAARLIAALNLGAESEEDMPFVPRDDWKAGDDYEAARIIELEAAAATGEAAATEVANLATSTTAALGNKVDASTTPNQVYGVGSQGQPYLRTVSGTSKTSNTVPVRGSNGIIVVGDPTSDDHAATKKYVDDLIAALDARVAALETPTEG